MNPGFSSTKGILIYTGKFSQVTYDEPSGTAVIGSGLIWDTVYERLESYNVTVAGGRVTGVSEHRDSSLRCVLNPAGNRWAWAVLCSAAVRLHKYPSTLYANGSPAGYSLKTNQYGLSIDSTVGFNLVLPNGTVTYVTQSTHPELFFGLKGGFNNFVSHFLRTHRSWFQLDAC
jgi:FAD/FMN-containing dehydrogenase